MINVVASFIVSSPGLVFPVYPPPSEQNGTNRSGHRTETKKKRDDQQWRRRNRRIGQRVGRIRGGREEEAKGASSDAQRG